jgi:predicted nucleic acid-binding Zn ribbon protein
MTMLGPSPRCKLCGKPIEGDHAPCLWSAGIYHEECQKRAQEKAYMEKLRTEHERATVFFNH